MQHQPLPRTASAGLTAASANPWQGAEAGRALLRLGAWGRRMAALEWERRRPFVWLPVAFGSGIGLYFAADAEPALWAPLVGLLICVALAVVVRRRPAALAVAVAFAVLFAGFAAARLRTISVATPVLVRPVIGELTGFVRSVDDRGAGSRLVIVPTAFADLPRAALPTLVRVTTRAPASVRPGEHIAAMARLMPPPEPALPGGYDFARDAFYRGLGAVGSLTGPIRPVSAEAGPGIGPRIAAAVDEARGALTERIAHAYGGQAGAVAAALVTGKRGQITEETNAALRGAGIYHIVSISGLHMVLAAGAFFWIARALLALVPAAALGWPVKKIAALVAACGAIAYCIFTGSDVATERSLLMTLVMLGAILADRPVLSMRNLAIAALLVLAMEPESLLGPSFQMSFAAVAGLIAAAERYPGAGRMEEERGPRPDLVRKFVRAAVAIVVTTAVAEFATGPFSSYHFHTLNPLGILGNALTLPFVSFVVMPAAVLGVLAWPFGLDGPVWWVMGLATEPVLWGARFVASLDYATVVLPAMPLASLLALVAAMLWGTLWTTPIRWLAVLPLVLGLSLMGDGTGPEVIADRTASGAAVRGADGRLLILGKPSGFVVEQWLRADGDARLPGDRSLKEGVRCDALGCVAHRADGGAVAWVSDPRAFAEDCRRADIIVSRHKVPTGCNAAAVLDGARLARQGATALYVSDGEIDQRTARDPGARRPWMQPLPPLPRADPQSRQPEPSVDEPAEPFSSDAPD